MYGTEGMYYSYEFCTMASFDGLQLLYVYRLQSPRHLDLVLPGPDAL